VDFVLENAAQALDLALDGDTARLDHIDAVLLRCGARQNGLQGK
jgi:hypothetical protein